MSIQMNVTLEFEVANRVRSYEFVISGESFPSLFRVRMAELTFTGTGVDVL